MLHWMEVRQLTSQRLTEVKGFAERLKRSIWRADHDDCMYATTRTPPLQSHAMRDGGDHPMSDQLHHRRSRTVS